MEFPSIPGASIDLNLSLAHSSNHETTHENVVFPHSNFQTDSTSVQAANMHNEIPATINIAASVANVGLRMLARNQKCASLTALVASLKAKIAELHGQLKQSN
ncbi:hypothetical protein ACE6H2_017452 [Prunus campanulata]